MRNFIFFVFLFFSCQRGEEKKIYNHIPISKYLNHNDTVKYVGKEQCRSCHVEIYDSYVQTGMGKSLNYATLSNSALNNSKMIVIYDSIKNLSYEPFFKNDSLYIKEFRINNFDTTHKLIKKVDYKIGSGNHTNSHLFEINGYLHQIPYTYYTQDGIADLPPGYENGNNTRFDREIGLECMSCHNAYSPHVEESRNKYHDISLGIDCERCHGPGELHVQRMLAGKFIDTSRYIDYSIVNPEKLPLDLQFDICQRCHLQGTSILAENKTFESFKPGMHLNDIMDTYLPKYENDHSFIMASHVDRLKQSLCFQSSDITCITCHNPHKPVKSLTTEYFDNKCMQCHEVCADNQKMDCASCHMPQSSSSDIMHVSISDHKIGVHTENSSAKGAFLGLFSINNPNPTNLSKAKAYLKRFESFERNYFYLDSAFYFLSKSTNNFTSYIQYYYLKNDYEGLIEFVNENTLEDKSYTISELAIAYSRMAEVFGMFNLNNQTESYHKKAIVFMPFVLDYKIKYASFLYKNNKFNDAKSQYLEVIKLNPTIKQAHSSLGMIYILENNFELAESSLKKAISLDPDYILAYENLVVLYQQINDNRNTKLYLSKILEIDPNHRAKSIIKNLDL